MRTLAFCVAAVLAWAPAARAADTIDLDFNLWLDGRWVCGSVLPVTTGEETTLCEAKHAGKTVRLRGELNALDDDKHEIHARIVDVETEKETDRFKFLIVTLKDETAEISEVTENREKYRFKADVVHTN